MSDFVHDFWGFYIQAITLVSILACAVFLWSQQKRRVSGAKVETTGHVWDGDLAEWNNPLPNWWRWLFYITIVFGLVYLTAYPGLGGYGGMFGWSSQKQYQQEVASADAALGPLYAKYTAMDIKDVAADPNARVIGQNLYLNYCAQCHASDARGSKGFPNLADADWLYGGAPETIKASILAGRHGVMPPLAAALGPDGAKDTAHYVMSIAPNLAYDKVRAARGKEKFMQVCAACHGVDGKGNQALGAPNLTDAIWLYGPSEATIIEGITYGRNNVMPGQGPRLGESKAHLLAAYIWGLSNEQGGPGKAAPAAGGTGGK